MIDKNLFIIFVTLNIVNVIIQTIKSLCTIKCGKVVAALVNAVAYGLYTIVLVYTVCDLPLELKVIVVALANFVGVFCVKLIEEKLRKDKLYKIEVTIPSDEFDSLKIDCDVRGLTYNYIDINKYFLFNFYCPTKEDSKNVKELLSNYSAKYFVSETKIL